MWRDRLPAITVGGVVLALIIIGWLVGAVGWPGEPSGCIAAGDCSCEAFSGGAIVQPVNTLSSLALVVAGLAVMLDATTRRGPSTVYGFLVVFLGVGSAAFHASMTEWGGWLDLLAVHAFVGLLVLVDAASLGGRSSRWVHQRLALWIVVAGAALRPIDKGYGKYSLGVLLIVVAFLELRIARSPVWRDRRWLAAAAAAFAVGAALQWLGRDGGPLCDPDSLVQAHAAWHVLAAFGVVAMWRYLVPVSRQRS